MNIDLEEGYGMDYIFVFESTSQLIALDRQNRLVSVYKTKIYLLFD